MVWLNTNKNRILRLQEHQLFPESDDVFDQYKELKDQIEFSEPTQNLNDLKLLGMDLVPHQRRFQMSYYIGVDWIDRKQGKAIEVLPKIHGIDFQSMMEKCLERKVKDIDKIFLIRDEDEYINIPNTDFHLEPFIIITFLNFVENIVKKGLKSNFVVREEQLEGKIKGKIMLSSYLKHGFANNRKDKIDCRYDEYSTDCLENQILKSSLLIIKEVLSDERDVWSRIIPTKTKDQLQRCLSAFQSISELRDANRVNSLHVSPMFTDYRSALKMAKMIIRKQGIGISSSTEDGYQLVPPFIIDMSLLFEKYIYALMLEHWGEKAIEYQSGSRADRPDFLKADEHLIIDTKYIPKWEEKNITDNIRQLSGYGRSEGIRNWLGMVDDSTCPCLIIYPNRNGVESFETFSFDLLSNTNILNVSGYQQFYKLPIKLPSSL